LLPQRKQLVAGVRVTFVGWTHALEREFILWDDLVREAFSSKNNISASGNQYLKCISALEIWQMR